MKRVKFGTAKPKTFSASAKPGVKSFADTSFNFGFNVTKKKGKGGGRKRKPPAGGGS